jgi:hypothetical protein
MTLYDLFWGIGDLLTWALSALQADGIGNIVNYSCIVFGFLGLFYWLNLQRKFNAEAESNPNQRK